MPFAEVAVSAPVVARDTFTYGIPQAMDVAVGQAVWAPFGTRLLQGIVVGVSSTTDVSQTRDIAALVEPPLTLSPSQLGLALWLKRRYLCPYFEALRSFLPPGFERQPAEYLQAAASPDSAAPELQAALELLVRKKRWRLDAAQAALGGDKRLLEKLLKLGLVTRKTELGAVRVRPRTVTYFTLAVGPGDAEQAIESKASRSRHAAEVLRLFIDQQSPLSAAEIKRRCPSAASAVQSLEKLGLVSRLEMPQIRDPLAGRHYAPQPELALNAAQRAAVDSIAQALANLQRSPEDPGVFLLFGVTGSGKTEVYLQALARAIALGKRAIVLVPEISLTPQAVQRFAGRFPGRVAIIHSQLSLGEQYDEWQRIERGEFDVVIGSRSAVFAPQPALGLIVVDEEHEPSYKQEESSCCYHARDMAIKRAELEGAVVILGSATPDVGTFFMATQSSRPIAQGATKDENAGRHPEPVESRQVGTMHRDDASMPIYRDAASSGQGRYHMLSLPERVGASGRLPLAKVSLVDMRAELKAGNRSMFSRALSLSLSQTLSRGEQAILFLNRRGTHTFVQCRDCGFALRCRRCDAALTYHEAEGLLVCHHCNYQRRLPEVCPRCHSPRIKQLGLGTQGLESEVKRAFPGARVLRWDRDSVRGQKEHEAILNRFLAGEADILIGTQMIAKGLDMPGVTLAGVVMADMGLHLPDFRSAERTFQLISQVAGRAGRGVQEGQVIVQTYSPEHYAIAAAARQDYGEFYAQEIAYRRQYGNPPFSRLVKLLFSHTNAARCHQEAERLAASLLESKEARALGNVDLIGPTPAFIERLRGRYRWQLVLRGHEPARLLEGMMLPKGWGVEVDPVSLL
ncbi:MAG: primosomal protein N' [Chloroflexi bacterium]|nr:primosomal protein N' [Chloroflexota bacterium]MBI4288342.1 primosomal protein N' [Chloroflexota bacterium]